MADVDRLILASPKDAAAFRALVGLFRMRIYSFLIHLAGREAADDLFQEVWLRVFQAAGRYEPRGKGGSWLFKIANNVALRHIERRGRERLEPIAEGVEALPSGEPEPGRAAEQAEARRRLDAAIAGLPLEQRQVFLLREHGAVAFKEIAESLDIPLGTALSRMNAALEKLRDRLGDLRA